MSPDTSQSTWVFLNSAAGTLKNDETLVTQIQELYKTQSPNARVWAGSSDELEPKLKEAIKQGAERIIVGGGDGTISSAAAHIVGTKIKFGVLPVGTLNHFSKDVGIPLKIEDAVAVTLQDSVMEVDVSMVNERYFLNNASIGIYPKIAKHRNKQMERLGRSKWHALALACWQILGRMPIQRVQVIAENQKRTCDASFVFVGNNKYSFSLLEFGERKNLNEGVLSVYLGQQLTRWQIFSFAFRTIVNGLQQTKDFVAFDTDSMLLNTPGKKVLVGIDGEVVEMDSPLKFRTNPKSLLVLS